MGLVNKIIQKGDSVKMRKLRKVLAVLTSLALTVTPLFVGAFSASAYEQASLYSGKIYRIKNEQSGKYLTVCNGYDADNVNIIQKDLDYTLSQQFRVVYDSAEDAYRFYAMCSGNGTSRVLEIIAPFGVVEHGCNVVLKEKSDSSLQLWKVSYFENLRLDRCYIFSKEGNGTLHANPGDGSQYETSVSSPGNVYISNFDVNRTWKFELVNPSPDIEPGIYYIKNKATGEYMKLPDDGRSDDNHIILGSSNMEKWQVIYLGEGIYNFRPVSSPNKTVGTNGMASMCLLICDRPLSFNIIPDGQGSYRIMTTQYAPYAITAKEHISPWTNIEDAPFCELYEASDTQRWIFISA